MSVLKERREARVSGSKLERTTQLEKKRPSGINCAAPQSTVSCLRNKNGSVLFVVKKMNVPRDDSRHNAVICQWQRARCATAAAGAGPPRRSAQAARAQQPARWVAGDATPISMLAGQWRGQPSPARRQAVGDALVCDGVWTTSLQPSACNA